jgi:hypothetical protein
MLEDFQKSQFTIVNFVLHFFQTLRRPERISSPFGLEMRLGLHCRCCARYGLLACLVNMLTSCVIQDELFSIFCYATKLLA